MPASGFKYAEGAVHVRTEIGFRFLDRRNDIGACSKMKNSLHACDTSCHGGGVGNIGFDDVQMRISVMLFKVSRPADDKIVDHADAAALCQ